MTDVATENIQTELQQRAISGMDKIADWAESTESLVSEQMPLLVNDIIAWGIVSNGIHVAMCSIVLIFLSVLMYKTTKWCKDTPNWSDDPDVCVPTIFIVGISGIINVCLFFAEIIPSLTMMCQAWFTPRLYVLNFLKELM